MIAVARKGETSVRQVAKDFGVSVSCLARWLRLADSNDGVGVAAVPSAKAVDQAEPREAQKRIQLLEQENEIPRRAAAYFAQSQLPKRSTRWSSNSPTTVFLSRWPAGCWVFRRRPSIGGVPIR